MGFVHEVAWRKGKLIMMKATLMSCANWNRTKKSGKVCCTRSVNSFRIFTTLAQKDHKLHRMASTCIPAINEVTVYVHPLYKGLQLWTKGHLLPTCLPVENKLIHALVWSPQEALERGILEHWRARCYPPRFGLCSVCGPYWFFWYYCPPHGGRQRRP